MEKRFKRNFGRSIRSVSQIEIYKYLTRKIPPEMEAAPRYRVLTLLTLFALLPYIIMFTLISYKSKHYCSKKAQMIKQRPNNLNLK